MASTDNEWVPKDRIIRFNSQRSNIYRPKAHTREAAIYDFQLDAFIQTIESPTPVEGWVELACGYFKHPQADALFDQWLDAQGFPRTYPEGYVTLSQWRAQL